ncbi:MAG: zinc-dependent metalloprotease [Bacteroidota bacterium]|nr:zinc-dependent metalloprotease [Bacteroidota bacterium]
MPRFALLFAALAVVLTSCTTVNVTDPNAATVTRGAGSSGAAASSTPSKPAKPASPFKKWDDVLKDTKANKGVFNLHMKRDNTLYMEVQPSQLGMDFGFISHFSKGTGVFDIHDGLYLTDTRMMRFERVGDKIYLHHVNTLFTADEGSPLAESLSDNVGNSIIAAFSIESEHDTSKALLIDFTNFIVSDYMQLSERIKPYFAGRPVMFDKSRSYVSGAMAFPKNVEIDALLTYKPSSAPITSSAGVSDRTSIPAGVRYSFFALPEDPMPRRMADDRVGFFTDAQRDFSKQTSFNQMDQYVNRWRLEKKDPTAEISDPVQPIVFYIDRTVPHELRKWVREGIEGWQKAYEAAGFSNAIIAKEAPDDSTWSAEDMRYSTVRWSAAHQMGYAIGPSQTDPRTGEILNADILLSATFMRGWGSEWANLVGPNGMLTRMNALETKINLMSESELDRLCVAEFGKQFEMGLLQTVLLADGLVDPVGAVPEEFYGPSLRDLVFHEVGHTLGLRHNFRGSGSIAYNKLQDSDYTTENGLTLSVMDYAGTNINPDRDAQGDYVNMEVGAYDVWAISYGYTPDDDKAAEIARQSADPLHAFNTDGDSNGIDPLTSTWDLSSDPMAYADDQRELVGNIWPVIEDRLIGDDDAYARLRSAMSGLMFAQYRQLRTVAKMVGGSHFERDHKGDPDAAMPLTPVSGAEQRAAVAYILDKVMDTSDLPFNENLLNKAVPSRTDDWQSGYGVSRYDTPVYESVLSMQMSALAALTDRRRMAVLINTDLRQDDPYTVEELFAAIDDAIYGSFTGLDRYERNLQLAYVDHLGGIMNNLRPSPFVPTAPDEARTLARLELSELKSAVYDAMDSASSRMDKAHLLELSARVSAQFEIVSTRDAE